MARCEFREGQFEQSLLLDFERTGSLGGSHFRPSGGLENHMPFDLGLPLSSAAVARVLRRQRMLAGLPVNAPIMTSGLPAKHTYVVPGDWVNVLLQAKAPEYVKQTNKKTANQWKRWNSRYYRMSIDADQHGKLIKLEKSLGTSAIVRYATPAFYTWVDLRIREAARSVADGTHFQSPGRIGNHGIYTYVTPLGKGVGFSEPEDIAVTPLQLDVANALREAPGQPLVALLAAVWRATDSENPDGRPSADDRDTAAARELLGMGADVPLDPFGELRELDEELRGFLPQGSRTSFGDFYAALLALERHVEEEYGVHWLVVGGTYY